MILSPPTEKGIVAQVGFEPTTASQQNSLGNCDGHPLRFTESKNGEVGVETECCSAVTTGSPPYEPPAGFEPTTFTLQG